MREILDTGIEKLRAMLELPEQRAIVEDGEVIGYEVDTKVMALKLKALDMIDKRLHGGYTQRIEEKKLTLTKNLDTDRILDLDEEIKRLESGVMDVEFTPQIPRKK
jgi:hypothetical protein